MPKMPFRNRICLDSNRSTSFDHVDKSACDDLGVLQKRIMNMVKNKLPLCDIFYVLF